MIKSLLILKNKGIIKYYFVWHKHCYYFTMKSRITIILFKTSEGTNGDRLQSLLESIIPDIETFNTFENLTSRLRKPTQEINATIIFIKNSEELDKTLSVKGLLENIPIYLILSDNKKNTISKGHSLRPRLLSSFVV